MDHVVQQLVDRMAAHLVRPAVLEDRHFGLVAYSAHDEPVDDVREAAILQRHASAAVSRWLRDLGISDARRPVRVPANAALHMLPRICVPVRHKDLLLGYLWFVDADGSMTVSELEWCTREVAGIGAQMHRDAVVGMLSSERITEALRVLLTKAPMAAAAARELEDDGLLGADDGVVVAVVQRLTPGRGAESRTQERILETLVGAPYLARRAGALHLARKDHCALLLGTSSEDDKRLHAQLDSVRSIASPAFAVECPGGKLVIGVGGYRSALVDAGESYREARLAAMAASAMPELGTTVWWSRLGIYQVAATLAASETPPVLHNGVRDMLEAPDPLPLLETLETYLDVAGNAQVAAERLHLHRTSLYYRLQRVEQLARTDLKNGVERLALHLSLKVARMTGEYAPRRAASDVPRESPVVAGSNREYDPSHDRTILAAG